MKKLLLFFKPVLLVLLSLAAGQSTDHLLISEFVLAPSDVEFIELYNPTSSTIDLSDYYITDGTDSSASEYYYRLPEDSSFYSGTSSDFIARFPSGSTIGVEQYVILAKLTSEFNANYGFNPDFEFQSDSDDVPDMRDAVDSEATIGTTSGGYLSNSSEVLILFKWDGESDLVEDVDYVTWGNQSKGVDKTGIAIDGPDSDSDLSQYLDDTSIDLQSFTATTSTTGKSIQRQFPYEVGETSAGGNGMTGNNETGENLDSAFVEYSVTPGFGMWETSPQITSVDYSPDVPVVGDTLTVSGAITDIDGTVVTARLIYNQAENDSVDMTTLDGENYSGSVELISDDQFRFTIKAVDDSGNVTISPEITVEIQSSNPPEIIFLSHNPASPTADDSVRISLVAVEDNEIDSATLNYTLDENPGNQSEFITIEMTADSVVIDTFYYSTFIPPFDFGTQVTYYSVITDNHGLKDSTSLDLARQYTILSSSSITIAEIRENIDDLDGQTITVDGVITVPMDIIRTDIHEAFLQDESGQGIVIFSYDADPSIQRGDSIMITATVDEFEGKPELIDYSITTLDTNATIPFVEINIQEFNSLDYSYTFVKLEGTIIARSNPGGSNTGANIVIQDESGGATTIRIWNSTNILYNESYEIVNTELDSLLQVGNVIEVSGIGDSYEGSSQILPAFENDIVILEVNEPEPTPDLSIAEIRENIDDLDGQTITVDGVITVPMDIFRTDIHEAFLQDESGQGIVIFSFDADPSIQRGDSIMITATVDEYEGKPELIDYSITTLDTNAAIPFVDLDIQEFNTLEYSYTFVKLWGRIIARSNPTPTNSGANIDIQDESGGVTTIRIWNSTNILYNENNEILNTELDSLLQIGTDIEVYGIGDSFSGSSQILPAYAEDISEKLEGIAGDFETSLEIEPYPFVPQWGEVIKYTYSFPDNARIKLRVFDLSGRFITTLFDEFRGISFYKEAIWDGRNDLNEVVPPGVYLMHLEVTDKLKGKTTTDVAPVVIGVRMK